jgi:hypothetical protein
MEYRTVFRSTDPGFLADVASMPPSGLGNPTMPDGDSYAGFYNPSESALDGYYSNSGFPPLPILPRRPEFWSESMGQT